jgi:hypothetical protein
LAVKTRRATANFEFGFNDGNRAVTTGVFDENCFGWDTSQFERLGNALVDGALDFVKLLARVQKSTGHGILRRGVAMFLEVGNLLTQQRLTAVLLFVQRRAFA